MIRSLLTAHICDVLYVVWPIEDFQRRQKKLENKILSTEWEESDGELLQ